MVSRSRTASRVVVPEKDAEPDQSEQSVFELRVVIQQNRHVSDVGNVPVTVTKVAASEYGTTS